MSSRIPAWQPRLPAMSVQRRTLLLYGAALTAGLSVTKAAPASANALTSPPPTRLTLPGPNGHLRLGTTILHLVDPSRPDPWVPADRVRELMIQIWYPAAAIDGYSHAPYFTPITARAYENEQSLPVLNWPITDAYLGAPMAPLDGGWPVILYSHDLGGERSETTSLVEELASRGYVVVTIDHIHDAGVVELPDGRVEVSEVPQLTGAAETAVTTKDIDSRVADVLFVLDQLAVINFGGNPDHEHRPLPRGLRGALDFDRVGMFGHSDGGSTTAHVLHVDDRVIAGINLDGTLWTPEAVAGSDHALLLFGRQDLDPYEASTWAAFWSNQRGPKLQLDLLGSTHHTFTDFAPLVPQIAPLIGMPPSWVVEEIGTINGLRAVTVERAYINAWFDMYLRHQNSDLLTGPSASYPEIEFMS
jgi:dienelactone hydrolase